MSRRPRVLFFSHSLGIGGIERSLIGLLRAMPIERLEVDLLLLKPGGELSSHLPAGIHILSRGRAYDALCGPIMRAIFSRNFAVGLARLAARAVLSLRVAAGLPAGDLLARSHRYALRFLPDIPGNYDLAISFWEPHDIVSSKVSARRKVGWVHTDHTSLETGVAVGFDAKAWSGMDMIAAVSTDVATAFSKTFPHLTGRLMVIENVLSPGWVRGRATEAQPQEMQSAANDGFLTLCSVGRITYQKGFDIAVEAAHRLKERGLRFRWYIIGFGPDEPMIRRRIGALGLSQEVVLLGALENPYPYMRACDIYIQPSRYEGKAVSVREAQMLGKPILVSDFATVRSQIEEGVDGYIAPAGVEGLVSGIIRLASDLAFRDQLARGAASRDYGNLSEVGKVMDLIPPSDG